MTVTLKMNSYKIKRKTARDPKPFAQNEYWIVDAKTEEPVRHQGRSDFMIFARKWQAELELSLLERKKIMTYPREWFDGRPAIDWSSRVSFGSISITDLSVRLLKFPPTDPHESCTEIYICVEFVANDVLRPGKKARIKRERKVPISIIEPDAAIAALVFDAVFEALQHELKECFRFDGRRHYEPHPLERR